MTLYGVAAVVATCLAAAPAGAQPTLSASVTTVRPGTSTTLTIGGPPGQHFALIGSQVDAGLAYAGMNLAVGTDVAVLALGVIDGTGVAVVTFTPPFLFSTIDRYYVQAVTSTSRAFVPLAASAGLVLRNLDLLGGIVGATGPLALQDRPDLRDRLGPPAPSDRPAPPALPVRRGRRDRKVFRGPRASCRPTTTTTSRRKSSSRQTSSGCRRRRR
jgi:hypothetical protein